MVDGGGFRATEESAATGVQREKRRDSHTEDWCQPALTSPRGCLLACWGGWGLGAEARASELRPQGEDWGWLGEHNLKGASAPQLAVRESAKKSGTAEEARDFSSLFVSWCARRGPLKGAPEMGVSCGYQGRPQRRA